MSCARCGDSTYRCQWQESDRSRHIRMSCGKCGTWIKFAPQIQLYIDMANNEEPYANNNVITRDDRQEDLF